MKTADAPKLADLTPPAWLTPEGQAYWRRHCHGLAENDLLNLRTADSFALCCDLWARVREMSGGPTTRSYLDTVKAYQSLAKMFRLLPCDKPGTTPTERHHDKPEFDF